MSFKAGYVNIIGNPNVGKSTLMNAFLGERLSIVTPKAQTTRHRILGIVNEAEYQMVFSDTPGIIQPSYTLHESMMKTVHGAIQDADVLLLMADVKEPVALNDSSLLESIKKSKIPKVLLLNKIDLIQQEELNIKYEQWQGLFPDAVIFPVSAQEKLGVEEVKKHLASYLPIHPPYFNQEELSDRSQRFFVAEIIREKLLLYCDKEVPYSCEVSITDFEEKPNVNVIRAVIAVERDSQKGIVIGQAGRRLKGIGMAARVDIEKLLGQKVFLELRVKVDPDWRTSEQKLKKYGYLE